MLSLVGKNQAQLARIPHNLRPSLAVPGRLQPARIPHNLRPWLAVLHRLQLARISIPHALRPTLAVNCRTHPATLAGRPAQIATCENTARSATHACSQLPRATGKDNAQPATLAGSSVTMATIRDTARSATHACSQLPHATGEDNAQPATFAGSSVTMATIGDTARSATPACSSLQIAADQAQMDEMRRAYPADADLTVVVDRLSSGRHGSIPGDTAAVRSLMAQEKSLKLENGLLYRKFVPANPGSQVTWQLIVPRQQRPLLFQEAHAGATSGHFAYKRTLEKLRQFAYWPGMSRDVEEWCRSCDTCAKRRSPVPRSQNRARWDTSQQPILSRK